MDYLHLVRECDNFNELLRRTTDSICFTRYLPDGNGGWDEGTIVCCSDTKASHYGMLSQDVCGKSNFKLMSHRDAKKARKDDIWVMENQKPLVDIREVITRPNGRKVYVSVTKFPWFYYKDKSIVCGVICIARDISLRVKAEVRLRNVALLLIKNVFYPLVKIYPHVMKLDTRHSEIKNTSSWSFSISKNCALRLNSQGRTTGISKKSKGIVIFHRSLFKLITVNNKAAL